MSYIHVTKTPNHHLDDYQRVVEALGPEPVAGRERHAVGEEDGALYVYDEWTSRADADRFAAERLFPAFAQAGLAPSAATTILAFETRNSDA